MKTKHLIIAACVAALTVTANAQSLLTTQPETSAQRTARELLAAPAQTRDVILNQISDANDRLWLSTDPQAVLNELGPKAGPLLQFNADFATLLAQVLTAQSDTASLARLQAIAAKAKPLTVHGNGTVTINPEPSPTPEPQE
jgi:hypothetical protein